MTQTTKIYAHGSLKRQCELCERDAEIISLREEIAQLKETEHELKAEIKLLNYIIYMFT